MLFCLDGFRRDLSEHDLDFLLQHGGNDVILAGHERAKGKKCSGMEGIPEEGSDMMGEDADPAVLDAGLAAAAQHVEHYEISGYGSVRTWAEQLGYDEHVVLLQQTLDEEKMTDELLTKLATSALNIEAEEEEEED